MKIDNKKIKKTSDLSFIRTIIRLLNYAKGEKIKLLISICSAILSTSFMIVGPKILGGATTEIFNGIIGKIQGSGTGIDFKVIGRIILILLFLYIMSSSFSYMQSYLMSGISQKISYRLRMEVSRKFNRLPVSYFDNSSRGDLISRVTNDIDVLSESLNQSMMQAITAGVSIIGVFIIMLSINLTMTLAAAILIPITIVVLRFVIMRSQKFFKMQQMSVGEINGKIEESFSGQNVIRGCNGEKFEQIKFETINANLYNTAWKSQFLSSIMMPIILFIGNLGYVIQVIIGGYMAINGKITVGDIQAFIQYMRSFTQPLNQITQIANLLQSTVAAADRIFDFLDEEEIDKYQEEFIDESRFKGRISFKNVDFGYTEDDIVIKDFNLDVEPGQKIAIVGATGAGKTTLVKLLMRFYKPISGTIYLDGRDISGLDLNDYREKFAMVLQDTWLFSGSIMDNLRYGKLDASDEEVYKAAKAAFADRFIKTQQDGYETILNEDSKNISQGQKQLLTIARAILSNPDILILDEATSSVDTRTELLIQNAMDNLIEGRTCFIIAHRLSTIRNANKILVLDKGSIVEQGSHEELLAKGGFYKRLYDSQY